ncbi:hypothetical protein [Methanoculleus chikugoensis]|uniref:hypothetical protein n=1 Tax=Methanoculleus chikugoensis TaxID=118126 RepID=UPI0006D11277|nr:hypothetical protein [Methanoculleus chikugoensis]
MLEQNASVGEYYEQVCPPEFLESMPPPEVRAHLYNTTMARHGDLASGREFVPPGKQVAIAIASPVIPVCGVPVALVTIVLAALGILILLAGVLLVRERIRSGKGG